MRLLHLVVVVAFTGSVAGSNSITATFILNGNPDSAQTHIFSVPQDVATFFHSSAGSTQVRLFIHPAISGKGLDEEANSGPLGAVPGRVHQVSVYNEVGVVHLVLILCALLNGWLLVRR